MLGVHELVMAQLCISRPHLKTVLRPDWQHYSKDRLCHSLGQVDWSNNFTIVKMKGPNKPLYQETHAVC